MGLNFWKKDKTTTAGGNVPALSDQWESCVPDMDVIPDPIKPREWTPQDFGIKVLIAGNLDDVRKMSGSVMDIQTKMKEQFTRDHPGTEVLFSIGTYLDGCRHETGWSSNPTDIGATSTRWHCYQTDTMFHQSLHAMLHDGQEAKVVLLVGERFNDDVEKTVAAAKALRDERGTRIFCLSGVEGKAAPDSFSKVAEAGDGLVFPRLTQNGRTADIDLLIQEIAQNVFCKVSGKSPDTLPAPANDKAREIRALLTHKMK